MNDVPLMDEDSGQDDWLRRACSAYRSSTSYFETNYHKRWQDSIRAFNSEHPEDSKYLSPAYGKRSSLYRPKTRSIIRKNEAAAAQAFFSNLDIVNVEAGNMGDRMQQASAEVMKQLLQYRLTKSIKWFHTVIGGIQDAQKTGTAVARLYWDYREDKSKSEEVDYVFSGPIEFAEGENGEQIPMNVPELVAKPKPKVLVDKPVIKLIPIENIRIDPAADWMDAVESSPFIIEEMPMYVCDIKDRMKAKDPKTGKPDWIKLDDDIIRSATKFTDDDTNKSRNRNAENARAIDSRPISDYEIVWVQRHIHRKGGEDWEFYTLADVAMLSTPKRLCETLLHGKRDYIIGCAILETHTPLASSMPELVANLQSEANEIANQRMDNIKLVLNKRFFVKRGADVDVQGLTRNVAGNVVMMNDPANDVVAQNWPDVTASSFQEQQLINADMDELAGNFNASSMDNISQAPAHSLQLLAAPGNTLVEYLLRTFTETFLQPVLRMLVQLEQAYETDEVILSLVAEKAKLFEKYGVSKITDDLLNQDLTLTVNVGMGATDPQQKMQKFTGAVMGFANLVKMQVPGLNMEEIGKELFGAAGYQDGKRFMSQAQDPDKAAMQQQLQQMQQQMQAMQQQLQEKQLEQQVKLKIASDKNETDIAKVQIQEKAENMRNLATHISSLSNQGLGTQVKDALQTG